MSPMSFLCPVEFVAVPRHVDFVSDNLCHNELRCPCRETPGCCVSEENAQRLSKTLLSLADALPWQRCWTRNRYNELLCHRIKPDDRCWACPAFARRRLSATAPPPCPQPRCRRRQPKPWPRRLPSVPGPQRTRDIRHESKANDARACKDKRCCSLPWDTCETDLPGPPRTALTIALNSRRRLRIVA